jgi:hypothetical protein
MVEASVGEAVVAGEGVAKLDAKPQATNNAQNK